MKSKWFVVLVVLAAFVATLALPVAASAEKDYQVIKKAQKTDGDFTYFKLLVTDNKTKKIKVKLTLPFSLIDFLAENTDGDIKMDGCSVNIKKFLEQLKKDGENTLIEVYEDDETVKIWFE